MDINDIFQNDPERAIELINSNQKFDLDIQNRNGSTPVHIAFSKRKNIEIAIALINSKRVFNLDIQDLLEFTPVHLAFFKYPEVAVDLLRSKRKFNLDIQDRDKNTPIHYAFEYNPEVAIALLRSKREFSLDIQNRIGKTPVHYAFLKYPKVAIELLRSKREFSLEIKESNKNTPIHYAFYKYPNVVIELLRSKKEFDLNIKNDHGETPLDLLSINNKKLICKELPKWELCPSFKKATERIIKLQEQNKDIYKWQDICSNLDSRYKLDELKQIAIEYEIQYSTLSSKRELCASIAKEIALLNKANKERCPEFISLVGDSLDDLPPEVIYKEGNYCFNVLELSKLIMNGDSRNPLTREPLDSNKINKQLIKIKKILTPYGVTQEDILAEIKAQPILTKEGIQKNRLAGIINKMNYSPDLQIFYNRIKKDWKQLEEQLMVYLPFRKNNTFDEFVNEFIRVSSMDETHLVNVEQILSEFLSE